MTEPPASVKNVQYTYLFRAGKRVMAGVRVGFGFGFGVGLGLGLWGRSSTALRAYGAMALHMRFHSSARAPG